MICQWFARCTNPAAGVVRHPILGDVPCCQRCADKLDLQPDDLSRGRQESPDTDSRAVSGDW